MNNKPLSLQELRKLIFENNYIIPEVDKNDKDNKVKPKFSLKDLYEKLTEEEKKLVANEVQFALKNGYSSKLNFSSGKKNPNALKYFVTELALLYKNDENKEKVYSTLLSIFYNENFFYHISRKIGGFATTNNNEEKVKDIVRNSLIGDSSRVSKDIKVKEGSLKAALESYSQNEGSFYNYLFTTSVKAAQNMANREFTTSQTVVNSDGQKVTQRVLRPIDYMSQQVGGDDESDGKELGDTIAKDGDDLNTDKSIDNSLMKKIYRAMISFGKFVLQKDGTEKQLRIFELYFDNDVKDTKNIYKIMSDEGFYGDTHNVSLEKNKNHTTGINDITTNKSRMNDLFISYIEDGYLDDYILRTLGTHTNFKNSINKEWNFLTSFGKKDKNVAKLINPVDSIDSVDSVDSIDNIEGIKSVEMSDVQKNFLEFGKILINTMDDVREEAKKMYLQVFDLYFVDGIHSATNLVKAMNKAGYKFDINDVSPINNIVKKIHKLFITAAQDGLLDKYMTKRLGKPTNYKSDIIKQIKNSWSMFHENIIPELTRVHILLEEAKLKFSQIENAYNKFNAVSNEIGKIYLNEGNEVATLNLFEHIKEFVENATRALIELKEDLKSIHNIAYEIMDTHPKIAEDIESTIQPMISSMLHFPIKLKGLLGRIDGSYNPLGAFGL